MKKIVTFLFVLVLHWSALAQTNPPGWDTSYRVVNGQQVWIKGGGEWLRPGEATFTAGTSGSLTGVTDVTPKMKDGRGVALKVTRVVSGASLFAAARSLTGPLTGGVLGVALVAVPAFIEWVAGDNAANIKIENGVLKKKDPNACFTNCNEYKTTYMANYVPTQGQACSITAPLVILSAGTQYEEIGQTGSWNGANCVIVVRATIGGATRSVNVSLASRPRSPDVNGWLPASMDDIAPYMTPRPAPYTYPEQVMAATKQPLPSIPFLFEGPPTPPAPPSPYVVTTNYPKPADKTTSETVKGNPYALPSNTPTVTRKTSGTATVNPGNTTTSGPKPEGMAAPNRDPLQVPTTTETTSTYNPTSDETVSNTVTKQDAAVKTSTSTTTTTINNTTTNNTYNSTVTNIVNTITNYIDQTTGQELKPPETEAGPEVLPDEELSECAKSPDTIGCAKFGDPPVADPLKKTESAVSITAVPFASSSACPSPLSFAVKGLSYSVPYTPLCDKLAQLKALFLAMAAVVAAYVVIQALKV